jgi:hypothetical protein
MLVPLLSPSPCSPTSPRSFAPSTKPSRPLSRSAHACREPPPPPAVDRCPFYGHRRVRAPARATVSSASLSAARDTLRCALPLSSPYDRAHRSDSCAAGAPPLSPRRVLAPPPLLHDSSVSPQGEQPAHALNLVIPALLLARLLARATSLHH